MPGIVLDADNTKVTQTNMVPALSAVYSNLEY